MRRRPGLVVCRGKEKIMRERKGEGSYTSEGEKERDCARVGERETW